MANLIFAAIIFTVTVTAVSAPARTWFVEKDGTGDFSVIYEAVDAAAAGDTIRIGPGRFEEYRLEPDYVRETYCCVHITTTGLTMIGGGADVTTIGLVEFDPHYEHYVIGVSCYQADVTIEDLTVNGVFEGVHFEGPSMLVRNCEITDCDLAVATWSTTSTVLDQLRIVGFHTRGVLGGYPNGTSITECEFVDGNGFAVSAVGGAGWVVRDCEVYDCTAGIQFAEGASGYMENCSVRVAGGNSPAIGILDGVVFALHDNEFEGEQWAAVFATGGTVVTATNNVFRGGQYTSIEVNRTPMDFHENDIINGGGMSVIAKWERGDLEEPYDLDLTDNFWGTNDPAQFDAWIDDYNDHHPMELWYYVIVRYAPFAEESTPVERVKLGDVKDLFR